MREMLSLFCPCGFGAPIQRRLAYCRRAFVLFTLKGAMPKGRYFVWYSRMSSANAGIEFTMVS